MKIVYVGRFDQLESNRDEEAVQHALQVLGHEMVPVREEMAARWVPKLGGDLLLFNKWLNLSALELARQRFGCVAFWYWDLVSFPDSALSHRNANRIGWMDAVLPLVDVGFLTDGDFAARHPEKLVWLPQGADERVAGRGMGPATGFLPQHLRGPDILFTGSWRNCGAARESFVTAMKARYGAGFVHVEKGLHGELLKEMTARSKIVIAPDGPVTDRYWSNRVWNVLGFGGFLLHPFCSQLTLAYQPDHEIKFYHDREDLYNLIRCYSSQEKAGHRREIAEAGLRRTLAEHTYRHRLERLIEEVKRRVR